MPDSEKSCNIPAKRDDHEVRLDQVPCCENEFQTVQTTNEYIKEGVPFNLSVDFAEAFICNSLNFHLSPKTNHPLFSVYSSPPIEKEIQTLFQTFLI
ncbi:MAG: hypothetical protein V2I46_13460 [Bacteroides sp.]|jgi:hypothetical protein|nr:hypothetical protein [Bacteroides sp.]